jgi:hypothetical protein
MVTAIIGVAAPRWSGTNKHPAAAGKLPKPLVRLILATKPGFQPNENPARPAPKRKPAGRAIPTRLLQFQGDEQADYDCEQSCSFNQSGHDEHGSLDFARSLRLTADGFHSATADAANTQAGTYDSQASTNAGTHYSQTNRINNLQQQRKKHGKKEMCVEKKLGGKNNPATPVAARLG